VSIPTHKGCHLSKNKGNKSDIFRIGWVCLSFALILLSAKEKQTQPILKMSSEAFAHLHYISFAIKVVG
jgi:hypothetical protein